MGYVVERAEGAGRKQRVARAPEDARLLLMGFGETLDKLLRMGMPGPEASIIKLHWTELTQAMPRVGMAMLGPAGLLYDTPAPAKKGDPQEFMQHGFLATPAASIASGTSEIMRGIIAMQVLGLPRGT